MKRRRGPRRVPGGEYGRGTFFVTLNAARRRALLGRVEGEGIVLSELGRLVARHWRQLEARWWHVTLDAFVVMPNHLHGLLMLRRMRVTPPERFGAPAPGSLSTIVRAYKAGVTWEARERLGMRGVRVWMRGFHDWRVRDEAERERVRAYIAYNPRRLVLRRKRTRGG